MGHAFLLASVLGLVAFAFGQGFAVILARILIIGAVIVGLWLAFMVIGERL